MKTTVLQEMRRVQEVRLEDCSSQARLVEVPWEETMRMMPPLLELMDMVHFPYRRPAL